MLALFSVVASSVRQDPQKGVATLTRCDLLLIRAAPLSPVLLSGQNDVQARTQFNLWSIFPAPLLISQNVLTWSEYALETYSNTRVIAVNQDMVEHGAGARIAGGDLSFPCTPSAVDTCSNVWGRVLADKCVVFIMMIIMIILFIWRGGGCCSARCHQPTSRSIDHRTCSHSTLCFKLCALCLLLCALSPLVSSHVHSPPWSAHTYTFRAGLEFSRE